MATQLNQHFRQQRIERALSLGDLARLCGYQNVSKGANRIKTFEERGDFHPELIEKLAAVLEIDDETIASLNDQDHAAQIRRWLEWVNQPVPMMIRVKKLPAFAALWRVPETIHSQDEAEQWARELAKVHGAIDLYVNRKVTVSSSEEGNVVGRHKASPDDVAPFLRLGKSRRKFRLVHDADGRVRMQVQD